MHRARFASVQRSHSHSMESHVEENSHPTYRIVQFAGLMMLVALFIDVAGTKWGSYIPTPVPELYLADLLLALSAFTAGFALIGGFRPQGLRPALVAAVGPALYVLFRMIEAQGSAPLSWSYWLRDVAPFAYLALIPLLVGAASSVSFHLLLRTLRAASFLLALWVAAIITGLLHPIHIGTQVPAFSPRPDVDNVVLGIGVIAFGDWGTAGKPRRTLQLGFAVLAAMNYSRAGLLAAMLCALVALLRERRHFLSHYAAPLLLILASLLGLVLILDPIPGRSDHNLEPPQAVARLIESDIGIGTTSARIAAWGDVLYFTHANGDFLMGAGPGKHPVIDSGAVAYLSGSNAVRAPHSWPIGAIAFHGVVGLGIWLFAYSRVLLSWTKNAAGVLAVTAIFAYSFAALFGVIVESPFGSLPMVVLASWLLASRDARS
jgi:hypothetical protein